jgi:hypothetical protein
MSQTPNKQTLIIDEAYMVNLMTEELCNDGPLSDLRVETVSQEDDGSFVIVMGPKEDDAK